MKLPEQIPPIFKNFYFVTSVIFLIWMLFFDSNDLFSQFRLSSKLRTLEHEMEYYQEKIEEVKDDREELLSNDELMEKYARERYFMKKPNEDLYVIVEKED